MKNIRIILALLLIVFCGAGGGAFLTFTDTSLLGTFLYTAFPFAVGILFMAIQMNILGDLKRVEKPEAKVLKPAEIREPLMGHRPKVA